MKDIAVAGAGGWKICTGFVGEMFQKMISWKAEKKSETTVNLSHMKMW